MDQASESEELLPISQFVRLHTPLIVAHCQETDPSEFERLLKPSYSKDTFGISGVSRTLSHQLVRHRAGVAFDQQLQPDQVLRHVPPVRQKIQPKFRRPGVIRHEMTPEEQQLVESWVWSRGSSKPAE